MKYNLNKELIEGLRDSTNNEFVENINNLVYYLVTESMKELAVKSSFIQIDKISLIPVNEIYLGAVCSNSEYTYFLGIPNKEIELNSLEKKHFFKNLWNRFVRAWRISRNKPKRKKKKNDEEDVNLPTRTLSKYTIDDLKTDIVNQLSNFVTPTTIIYEYEDHISIIGREDLGSNVKVNIYVCLYDDKNDVYKLYNGRKNKFYDIDLKQRFKNLNKKYETCGENFVDMVRIYNSLYSKAFNKIPNQILIESLLCACPDSLYSNDLYQTFINISNYIRLVDVSAIRSIYDNTKSIFKEKLIVDVNAQVDFSRLIKLLDLYKI